MIPIIMFCILFGLSMDYEVVLLNRVRYEYEKSRDNTEAVARSLERTGRMITGAAAIMALVLFAFGFSSMTVVKAMGIGMGISIVVDATIVRCLLVPATMRLLGRWNWWAPRTKIGLPPESCLRKEWFGSLDRTGENRFATHLAAGGANTRLRPRLGSAGSCAPLAQRRRWRCGGLRPEAGACCRIHQRRNGSVHP